MIHTLHNVTKMLESNTGWKTRNGLLANQMYNIKSSLQLTEYSVSIAYILSKGSSGTVND